MLDQPFTQVFGASHRRVMHDENTIKWAENNYGPVIALIVKGHIALDMSVTSMKKRNENGDQ